MSKHGAHVTAGYALPNRPPLQFPGDVQDLRNMRTGCKVACAPANATNGEELVRPAADCRRSCLVRFR